MQNYGFLFFIITSLCFCQNKDTTLRITNISTEDTLQHFIKYSIDYELKNASNHDVLFFNSTDNPLEMNYRNTKVIYADYAVYDDKQLLNEKLFIKEKYFLDIKHFTINSEGKSELEKEQFQDSIRKKMAARIILDTVGWSKKRDSIIKIREKQLSLHNDFEYIKNSIITLKPNESITGTLYFFWYKKKYRKIGAEEFYFDENPKQLEIKLHISTSKEMKRYFSEKEFKKIEGNPNFIDGEFVSDKVAINFHE